LSHQSLSQQANDPEKAASFIKALHSLTDSRDSRGKRINLAFTVGAVVLAIMSGRSKLSSIHRYIWNRAGWLRKVTKMPKTKLISRAHWSKPGAVQSSERTIHCYSAALGCGIGKLDSGHYLQRRQRQNQVCRPGSRYGILTDIRGEAFPQGESQELPGCA